MKTKIKAQFANSAKPQSAVAFFANEISIGQDGWVMITKFGDYPSTALFPQPDGTVKKVDSIQRVDRNGAEQMVAQFINSRRGIRKFAVGCNIYDGHPDMPDIGKFYPDKAPKGVFADLEVREDGLYGLPIFTDEGGELVEKKKRRAFSGRIGESEPCGNDPTSGKPIFRPTQLFSAGLTNTPRLPVHFFNSDDTLADAPPAEAETHTKHQNTMKKKIMALFAALALKPQFANAEEPTEGEMEAAVGLIETKVASFANERTTLAKKLLGVCGKVGITFANEAEITDPAATLAQVEEKVVTLNTDLTAARGQFANERADRIKDELEMAISTGRITAADKPTWEGRLKVDAQFGNERTAIRALKPAIKTTSITLTRGGRAEQVDISNPQTRAQFANEVLGEIAKELKVDRYKNHNAVYAEAQRRHPALFEGMQSKEIKMPGKK